MASCFPPTISEYTNIAAIHQVCGHFMPPFADFPKDTHVSDFVFQSHPYYNSSLRCHIVFCNGRLVTQKHVFGECTHKEILVKVFRDNINSLRSKFGNKAIGSCTLHYCSYLIKNSADGRLIPELDLNFRESPMLMKLPMKFRRRAIHFALESYLLVLNIYMNAHAGNYPRIRKHRRRAHS